MNKIYLVLTSSTLTSIFISCLILVPCNAQVIPDKTLRQNTSIRLDKNTTIIEGGSQVGSNLFHSFLGFSVIKDSIAFFNNTNNIQNIIGRVTGDSISNIDGLIRANGNANLFFINPNGIIFGQNARLDIGGTFVGSTASSINFANGFKFSARNPQPNPLLTISVPIGLEFQGIPATIEVKGTGYIFQDSDFRVPLDASKFSNSLQVSPGKTLALIGGNILLNGGILSNRDGRIEIISVERGKLNIEQEDNKLFFNKDSNVLFNDIALINNSLIFVNSYEGKDNTINIQGSNIKILSGSSVFSQNQGNKLNGEIKINASNLLEIKESTPLSLSSIFTSNFGITPGENIQIIANKINIEGAQIATTNFSKASGGNITVISDDFNSAGSTPSPVNPFGYGGINSFNYNSGSGGNITAKIKNLIIQNNGTLTTTTSFFSGQGGNLNLTSENITLKNGGNLGSLSFGNGKGGDVLVNTNNFKLIGQTEIQSSSVTAITFGNGNAGNLAINTLNLLIQEGGTVSTNTYTSGNAGNININAFNSIEVSKKSSITSAADFLSNDTRRAIFNFSSPLSGNAGSITLNTFNLNVTNDAMVSVRNTGAGNAGNINITANKVNISNGGGITATTAIAEGGNIGIESNIVQLNNGTISATAGQQGTNGNGGNIRINADVITGFNNSSITANAFKGRGGNIRIKTQGLFLSRNSLLTASSQQGIDGTVETNASRTQSELAKVKAQLPTPTPEIASVCPGKAGAVAGKFVDRGRESLPDETDNPLYNRVFLENTSVAVEENESLAKKQVSTIEETTQIAPAKGWVFDSKGQVTLVATNPNQITPDSLLNANSCSSITPVSQLFPSIEASNSNE